MDEPEKRCVFCEHPKVSKIISFTEKTFEKCKQTLMIRKKFGLKFSDTALPAEINDTAGYHRQCYSYFTALKSKFRKQFPNDETIAVPSTSATLEDDESLVPTEFSSAATSALEDESVSAPSSEVVEEEEDAGDISATIEAKGCFFCDKLRKTVHGRIQMPSVSKTQQWLETIKDTATEIDDTSTLDKIAAASKTVGYHSHCKVQYFTKCRQIKRQQKSPKVWHEKRDHHTSAFEKLCTYISLHIVEKKEFFFYTFIRSVYIEYLNEKYATVPDDDRPNFFSTQHLQEKILNYFNGKVKFLMVKNKKIMAPFECSIPPNVDILEEIESNEIIYKAANVIRSAIFKIEKKEFPDKLSSQHFIDGECEALPAPLHDLLQTIICGDRTVRRGNKFKETVISSIAQDIVYATMNGNLKTSKHVCLGIAIKSLTNSKKIINLLNRFGHCISYTGLLELETEATLSLTNRDEVCPAEIKKEPNLSTGVAFDNFDRFVETLTGKDTLHDTVGIIYQNVDDSKEEASASTDEYTDIDFTNADPVVGQSSRKRKRRTFNAVLPEIARCAKKPKIVEAFRTAEAETRLKVPDDVMEYKYVNHAWMASHALGATMTPMWVGFNTQIFDDKSPMQKVAYLTPINISPTDTAVVRETLCVSKTIAAECEAEYIQVSYDLQVAKVALGIQSAEKPTFDRVFIHLGMFHVMMAFLKAVGKFIDNSGLTNVMENSGMIAGGSINGFLMGTNYNRCKRQHPIASLGLQIIHFKTFLKIKNISIDDSLLQAIDNFKNSKSSNPKVENEQLRQLFDSYESYRMKTLQGVHGKTAQFYMIYVNLIDYYLTLQRSIRTSNFEMFVYILPKLTNLFFTFNQPNYSRAMVLYREKLLNVDDSHPGLKEEFEKGCLGVKRTKKPFNRIPIDLTLEQTINADAARSITSMTNSISARQRLAKSHGLRTAIISHVFKEAGLKRNDEVASELKNSVMKKNQKSLSNFMESIDNYMNPFDPTLDKDKLYNMTNGEVATPEIKEFLLNVERNGNLARETFISECRENPERYELRIKRTQVHTFAKIVKKHRIVVEAKVKEVRLQRDYFGRLVALASNIDMEEMVRFPVTPVPASLSHIDGTFHKNQKSQFLTIVEPKVTSEEPEIIDIIIIDGFFLLNTLKELPRTFGDLSRKFLHHVSQQYAERIDLIFDRYFTPSIKDVERILRGRTEHEYQISGPQQVRPSDFAKEMKNMRFKEALVTFLIKHWATPEMTPFFGTKKINVNYDKCYGFHVEDDHVVRTIDEDLSCEIHEEADTKIVYHVCQIQKRANVVIRCADTNVLIIMLGNIEFIQSSLKIWIDFGTGNKRRYIDVTKIYSKMGPSICASLPGYHALTGCDYNPAFFRKGKKKPFDIVNKSDKFQKALINIGDVDIETCQPTFDVLEELVSRLYNLRKTTEVNLGRYEIFLKTYKVSNTDASFKLSVKNFDASSLPPCQSELKEHLLRTLYITRIWRNAHKKDPVGDLDSTDYGWVEKDGTLQFRWFTGEQLPSTYSDVITKIHDSDDQSDNESHMDKTADISTEKQNNLSDESDDE